MDCISSFESLIPFLVIAWFIFNAVVGRLRMMSQRREQMEQATRAPSAEPAKQPQRSTQQGYSTTGAPGSAGSPPTPGEELLKKLWDTFFKGVPSPFEQGTSEKAPGKKGRGKKARRKQQKAPIEERIQATQPVAPIAAEHVVNSHVNMVRDAIVLRSILEESRHGLTAITRKKL